MLPTSIRPGRNTCPRGQCVGGRTIHAPDVDRTNSPTAAMSLIMLAIPWRWKGVT